ncbi:MAG: SDR family NAD(P)-dependent oxidoreductase [Candidatus Dormibacteria bacterium]
MARSLAGRVAVVTGSARGIGKAVALRLAEEGARIVVNDILDEALLQQCVRECESRGSSAIAVRGDVGDDAVGDALIDTAERLMGGVDIVVNNAFWEERGSLVDLSRSGWDQTLRVSLTGAMVVSRAALRSMAPRGHGVIINVSSVHALAAGGGLTAAYDAAKAGLLGLTRSVAVAYGPQGVRCNAIAPGLVITERNAAVWQDDARLGAVMRAYPLRRAGTPEDIAACVAFLVSDDASFINGACVAVDGGMTAMLSEAAVLSAP